MNTCKNRKGCHRNDINKIDEHIIKYRKEINDTNVKIKELKKAKKIQNLAVQEIIKDQIKELKKELKWLNLFLRTKEKDKKELEIFDVIDLKEKEKCNKIIEGSIVIEPMIISIKNDYFIIEYKIIESSKHSLLSISIKNDEKNIIANFLNSKHVDIGVKILKYLSCDQFYQDYEKELKELNEGE